MAIVVEDGTIVSGANSYVSTSTLTTFATARGVTLVTDTEQLLIKAMDYIESLPFKGTKFTRDQALQWPRVNVYIDGYYWDADEIPQQLKDGLCHCAIAIDQGDDPLQNVTPKVKREKVDVLEIEYADGGVTLETNRRILNKLSKLLTSGSGNITTVSKG